LCGFRYRGRRLRVSQGAHTLVAHFAVAAESAGAGSEPTDRVDSWVMTLPDQCVVTVDATDLKSIRGAFCWR
jgi:hypothetical protein